MTKCSISNTAVSSKQSFHYQHNEVIAPLNLKLAKDGRQWSTSRSGHFIQEKNRVSFEYEVGWNSNKQEMEVLIVMFIHHLLS
jgi:hypothetical protein